MAAAQNWVMLISEQHRYQGVSYKSDIIVVSGDFRQSMIDTHRLQDPGMAFVIVIFYQTNQMMVNQSYEKYIGSDVQ